MDSKMMIETSKKRELRAGVMKYTLRKMIDDQLDYMDKRKAVLVYQGGIANVFEVNCLSMTPFGRVARRLLQSDFKLCQYFAMGLGAAGVVVRTAHCNKAGDISEQLWSDNMESAVFSDEIVEVSMN